jgi:hypothetical protein
MLRLDPVIGTTIEGAFALLFALASIHKLRDLEAFGVTLRAYGLVPETLVRPVTVFIALTEFTLAVALLAPAARRAADWAGVVLLTLYGVTMTTNLLRGRHDLRCGCLGPGKDGRISRGLVWRNALMALVLGAMARMPWSARPLSCVDICTVALATGTLTLVCAAANGLAGLPYEQYGGAVRQ